MNELKYNLLKNKMTYFYSTDDVDARKITPYYKELNSKIINIPNRLNGRRFSHLLLFNQISNEQIRSLEKSIFEATNQFSQKNYVVRSWKSQQFIEIYKQNFRSVVNNLHPDSPVKNPRLLSRVLEGEFELSIIPFMSSYEMFPEKWFELKDKLVQREQKILEGNKSRATDQFKCRRCNKRECTYYELQTRSADEPMTIFSTCLNCGKEWRQG